MAAKLKNQLELVRDLREEKRKRFHEGILEPKPFGERLRDEIPSYLQYRRPIDKWADAVDFFAEGPKKAAVAGATATGLGMAMRRLMSHISIPEIFRKIVRGPVYHGAKFVDVEDYFRMISEPHVLSDTKRALRHFRSIYTDIDPKLGLRLEDIKILRRGGGQSNALGSYSPLNRNIKLRSQTGDYMKYSDPTAHNYFPMTVGHELEHWYSDFVSDQVRRYNDYLPGVFDDVQIDNIRNVMAQLLVDIPKDKHITKTMKSDFLLNIFGNYRAEVRKIWQNGSKDLAVKMMKDNPKLFEDVVYAYKSSTYSAEHASTAYEKMFRGRDPKKRIPYGHKTVGSHKPEYKATKAFDKAVMGLKEVGFQDVLEGRLLERAVNRSVYGKRHGPKLVNDIMDWYKTQPTQAKDRMKKAIKEAIEKEELNRK